MTRTMEEMIKAATHLRDELFDYQITAAQVRVALDKACPEWADEERADVVRLASHISSMEAQFIDNAVGEFSTEGHATSRALSKFTIRRAERAEKVRRTGFFEAMTGGPAGLDEARRTSGEH